MKNFVVRLFAPISVRVRAKDEAHAIRVAITRANKLDALSLGKEQDSAALWLEASTWRLDKDDFEGGVYESSCKGCDAELLR